MANHISFKISFLTILFSPLFIVFSQKPIPGYSSMDKTKKNQMSSFAVPYSLTNMENLSRNKINIHQVTPRWIYIQSSLSQLQELVESESINDFYFDNSIPTALADSARLLHYVNQVHNGTGGLDSPYTGKGVIVGIVDQGLDFTHPDFKNDDGTTRVLRYWDHTLSSGGPASSYGYGIVWNEEQINSGDCISTESGTGHGTTVAGMACGNANANGQNKGMAPEANLIIVESNFSLPNWTMTIADACDYIFKVADTLGMPAVVNLSLGTYLGSHDGDDPASELMESMLDEKPGRVIVCAAGNSGAKGKYHVQGTPTADTTFVWIRNNPNGSAAYGANTIYFDLWSDMSNANYNYAFGADRPSPSYGFRGRTDFIPANTAIGGVIYDTIYNDLGDRIATIEIYPEQIDDDLRIQVLFTNVDSTSYYFRFMTEGTGLYDMWSGSWLGLNDFVTTLPSASLIPEIINYQMPDEEQSIVSSWNCSEKVISVGNMRNRKGHTTKNNTYYTPSDNTPVGQLSPNSSKGPTRHNVIKPDVTASGDVALAAGPMWMLASPTYNNNVDINGWHARNGGTSMASPVVAGIAALYLESCPRASYMSFKNDLISTSYSDQFTGITPNNSYGYGKPHALNLLLGTDFSATVSGDNSMCSEPIPLTVSTTITPATIEWNDGGTGSPYLIPTGGEYTASVYDNRGCVAITDTQFVTQLEVLPILPIIASGNTLASLSFTNYQWTLNGVDIPGANSPTLDISPPYGVYTCYCVSDDGCISETPPFNVFVGMEEQNTPEINVAPNPFQNTFEIIGVDVLDEVLIINEKGQIVPHVLNGNSVQIDNSVFTGIYHLIINSNGTLRHSKITKL